VHLGHRLLRLLVRSGKLRGHGRFCGSEGVLREFLDLDGRPPSHDTFSRVFRMLDPVAFAACFQAYLDQLGAVCRGHIAIDGKTLRGAHERAAGASPLQIVSAFASEPG